MIHNFFRQKHISFYLTAMSCLLSKSTCRLLGGTHYIPKFTRLSWGIAACVGSLA